MKIFLSVTNDVITDQRIKRIASSLISMGNDVVAIGRKRKSSISAELSIFRVKLFSLLFNRGPLFYAEYNIRLFLFLIFHRFDVIVSNDLDTLPAGFIAARIKKKKLVFDSHELFPEVPELIGRRFVKKVWEFIEKLFIPKLIYSYTVCDSIADYYKNKYGIEMQVIRNVPVFKNASRISSDLKAGNDKIIIYQGAVNVGRGLELVIKSMNFINNARFVIIGEGDILNDLKKLVEGLKMTDKVAFFGRIPAERLHSYTVQADIGISLEEKLGLNYYYTLPNKLFDYIQANVPVLVSDFPEMGAIVKKYDIGNAILSSDPIEVAAIIKEMLEDEKRIKIWKKNLKKAAEELCWEREEVKMKDFYLSVFKNSAI